MVMIRVMDANAEMMRNNAQAAGGEGAMIILGLGRQMKIKSLLRRGLSGFRVSAG